MRRALLVGAGAASLALVSLLAGLLGAAACGSSDQASAQADADADGGAEDVRPDRRPPPDDPDADVDASIVGPALLSETGLYSDFASRTVASGLFAFSPRFEFWADGAQKSRWLSLPPGTKIDTSRVDHWVFPVGTKAF